MFINTHAISCRKGNEKKQKNKQQQQIGGCWVVPNCWHCTIEINEMHSSSLTSDRYVIHTCPIHDTPNKQQPTCLRDGNHGFNPSLKDNYIMSSWGFCVSEPMQKVQWNSLDFLLSSQELREFFRSNFRVCSCGLPSYPGLAYARLALVTRKFSQRRIKPTFSSLFERLYKQLYCRETKPTNQGHTWCGGSVTWKFSFSESDTIYTHIINLSSSL